MHSHDAVMHQIALYGCLPWMLLMNFAIFQYLTTTYYARRREPRVKLLILCAFVSFATLTLFAHPDESVVDHMNGISEVATVLTFLIQITITCRGVIKRVKVKSLLYMTYTAEVLIILEVALVVLNVVGSCIPQLNFLGQLVVLDMIVANASLPFVFFFRFHYTSMSNGGGWKKTWQTRKMEVIMYLLLVTHAYPFYVLQAATGWKWEYIQGAYMRALIVGCLALTLREKLRNSTPRRGKNANDTGAAADPLKKKQQQQQRRPQVTPMPSSPQKSDLLHATTIPTNPTST